MDTAAPLLNATPMADAPQAVAPASFRVAFCGPIGEIGKPAGGGYEAANRRTCDSLARSGLQLHELPYPKVTVGALKKLLRYAVAFVKAGSFLLMRRDHYDVLHLTPLNMHFALAETLLVTCARLAGKPVLVDIRAGRFVAYYEGAGWLYRRVIDRTLRQASQVCVEGKEYIPFVRQRNRRPIHYFPNYVDGPSLQTPPPTRHLAAGDTVRLLYFGRIVPEKGIALALQTLALLQERGHSVHLELIGDGPRSFINTTRQQHAHLPVTWTPSLPVGDILQRAGHAHFFFFASHHPGEGHSNALNEAMSVGLVPVCSTQGFTHSVVGNAGVVLPLNTGPDAYADAIAGIVSKGEWPILSARAASRVRQHFSEQVTVPALIGLYGNMLERPTHRRAEPAA